MNELEKIQIAKKRMITENLGLGCIYVANSFIAIVLIVIWLVFQIKIALAIGLVLGCISLVILWLLKSKAKEITNSLNEE